MKIIEKIAGADTGIINIDHRNNVGRTIKNVTITTISILLLLSSCISTQNDESKGFAKGIIIDSDEKKLSQKSFSSVVRELGGKSYSLAVKASPNDVDDKRLFYIYYTIIPAKNSESKKEPVFLLQGGPGAGGQYYFGSKLIQDVSIKDATYFPVIHENHDILFMDYRGTGFSEPFTCSLAGYEQSQEGFIDGMRQCAENIKKIDSRLVDYTTVNTAHDLIQILDAENIDKVILYGFSYGTKVSLVTARDYPERISKMMIDGVVTIESNFVSQSAEAIFKPLNDLDKIYQKEFNTSISDSLEEILSDGTVDSRDVYTAIIKQLAPLAYVEGGAGKAKDIIDALSSNTYGPPAKKKYGHGEAKGVPAIDAKYNYRLSDALNSLMAFGLLEEYPHINEQPPETFGFQPKTVELIRPYTGNIPIGPKEFEYFWPIFDLKESDTDKREVENPTITTPTIIFSGGIDFYTAPYWVEKARDKFTNYREFFFKSEGHTFSGFNNTTPKIIKTFLEESLEPSKSSPLDEIQDDDMIIYRSY